MSWTCPSCKQTFSGPCYHDCGLPKAPKPKSPLASVKQPAGRVDILIARLVAEAVTQSENTLARAAYAEVQPLFEQLLAQKLGPKTRRGWKLAADLFTLRDAIQGMRRPAA